MKTARAAAVQARTAALREGASIGEADAAGAVAFAKTADRRAAPPNRRTHRRERWPGN